jgi:hypothetical protein
MLSEQDLNLIQKRGVTKTRIETQINQLKNGFPILKIVKPAVGRDGVRQLTDKQLKVFVKVYGKLSKRIKRVKFVPSSGAATRMFKNLYEFLENYQGTEDDYLSIMAQKDFNSLNYMCMNLSKFAFYDDLMVSLRNNGTSIEELTKSKDFALLLRCIIEDRGLNYGSLPKGLLKFHRTFEEERTPVHEHLVEGIHYAASGKKVKLHFTVSSDHLDLFKAHVEEISPKLQKENKVKFDISYSIQHPSTDTIVLDAKDKLVRDLNGDLVFRPGGHGALIHNLNNIEADIIFIKNIDNVLQDRRKADTILYKKVLAGMLMSIRNDAAGYFKKLSKKVNAGLLTEVEEFMRKKLFNIPPPKYDKWSDAKKAKYIISILDRPIRVCGMVRNEGEPGGGPYWVENNDGSVSLQIVEGSQFAEEQKDIMLKSTHFNPVDLVCSIKDFKGKKYNLLNFVDENTGFINSKSLNGQEIKALELPGLWNGAMANWNSIFVEVPATTFSPVKTINDLLRTEHLFEKDLLQQNDDQPCVLD